MKAKLRTVLLILFAIFLFCNGYGQSRKSKQKNASPNFIIHPIADGVWAAIQNDQYGKAICNAGIVDLGDKTLVFDPFMTPQAARELKDAAEAITQKPVSIVVNSHFHNDHIRGNQVFSPQATIISTTFTRNEIARVEPAERAWELKHAPGLLKATRMRMSNATTTEKEELPMWIGYYEGMVESSNELQITLPDIVFNDSLWILGSSRRVKLVEFKDCHTPSDAVLLIPDEGIAFMGDILFSERHPWLSDGKPSSWQTAIQKFYNDPAYHTFIPGHGPVSQKPALKQLHEYLSMVQDITKAANSDSLQAEVLQQPIPHQFQHWFFGRFYQSNLQFLLSEKSKH